MRYQPTGHPSSFSARPILTRRFGYFGYIIIFFQVLDILLDFIVIAGLFLKEVQFQK
jgi:hypothetical protein